jgi:hypothetical protein
MIALGRLVLVFVLASDSATLVQRELAVRAARELDRSNSLRDTAERVSNQLRNDGQAAWKDLSLVMIGFLGSDG